MSRPARPERRDELLDALVDHLLGLGLTSSSLRPAAAAVGATPRTLLYHFGSKDRLEVAILETIRERERQAFAQWLTETNTTSVEDVVLDVWAWLADERRRPFLRLFFDAFLRSAGDAERYGSFAASAVEDWLTFFDATLRTYGANRREARTIGTAILSTLRGALLDLVATGDRKRLDHMVHNFVAGLKQQYGPRSPRGEQARKA